MIKRFHITVRANEEMKSKLREYAEKYNRTMSYLVQLAVEEWLERQDPAQVGALNEDSSSP